MTDRAVNRGGAAQRATAAGGRPDSLRRPQPRHRHGRSLLQATVYIHTFVTVPVFKMTPAPVKTGPSNETLLLIDQASPGCSTIHIHHSQFSELESGQATSVEKSGSTKNLSEPHFFLPNQILANVHEICTGAARIL